MQKKPYPTNNHTTNNPTNNPTILQVLQVLISDVDSTYPLHKFSLCNCFVTFVRVSLYSVDSELWSEMI
jgi:hypothetical protein